MPPVVATITYAYRPAIPARRLADRYFNCLSVIIVNLISAKWVIICYFVQCHTIVTASVTESYRVCQISSAYSLIVLSLEKNAEFAMLARDIACHFSLSE